MSAYAELAVTTNFSFLRGASHPQEMVATADELGCFAIGIADRNSFAGVVRAYDEAKNRKIKLLVGTRLVTIDGFEVLAYPTDRAAYGRLCRLLTAGNLKAKKGECHLTFEDILGAQRRPDAHCHYRREQCRSTSVFTERLAALGPAAPGRTFLAGIHYHRGDEPRRLGLLAELGERVGAPLVAVNDVYYHAPERRPLADVLTCVREKCTHRRSGLAACRQRRAASENAGGNGAAVRPLSRRHRPHGRDRQRLPLLARRAEIRISRRAGAARQDRAAASGRSHLGGRARALPARQISRTAFRADVEKRLQR